ncbi:MAG TPA: hypothetical protein VF800_06485 [Telluria sp.]
MRHIGDNLKMAIPAVDGGFKLRIYRSVKRQNRMASVRVKCGCCNEQLIIHHDHQVLEIGTIMASLAEWRALLLPLLLADSGTSDAGDANP